MKQLFLRLLTITLLITSITGICVDEISLPSDLSIDAIPVQKRFFLLGFATASLLIAGCKAGYNLHDLLHGDQTKKDESKKRSILTTEENKSTVHRIIPILYSAVFMSAAGYLSYICAQSIIKDIA